MDKEVQSFQFIFIGQQYLKINFPVILVIQIDRLMR